MGLYASAELSVGIIVGCLPTMPAFFHHIGPKIRRRIAGTGPEHGSSAEADAPKAKVLARIQRPFTKYGVGPSVSDSRNDSYHNRAQHRCEHLTLNEFDSSPPQASNFSASTEYTGKGVTTMRNDPEYGQNSF